MLPQPHLPQEAAKAGALCLFTALVPEWETQAVTSLLRASVSMLLGQPVPPPLPQGTSPCVSGSLRCIRGWHEASGDPEGLHLGVDGGLVRGDALTVAPQQLRGRLEAPGSQGLPWPHARLQGSGVGFELCPMGQPSFQPWPWLNPREPLGLRDTASAAGAGGGPWLLACCRPFLVFLFCEPFRVILLSASYLSFSQHWLCQSA